MTVYCENCRVFVKGRRARECAVKRHKLRFGVRPKKGDLILKLPTYAENRLIEILSKALKGGEINGKMERRHDIEKI